MDDSQLTGFVLSPGWPLGARTYTDRDGHLRREYRITSPAEARRLAEGHQDVPIVFCDITEEAPVPDTVDGIVDLCRAGWDFTLEFVTRDGETIANMRAITRRRAEDGPLLGGGEGPDASIGEK